MERTVGNFNLRMEQGGPSECNYLPVQTHGNQIVSSLQLQTGGIEADGVFIGKDMPKGGIATADCMPLVLFGNDAALLLHISRKTLVAGILDTAKEYIRDFHVTDVFIGPHICPQHFIFEKQGPEIIQFAEIFPTAVTKSKIWSVSLRDAVKSFLDELGVPPAGIIEDGRCTFEDRGLLSYRRALMEENRIEELRMITNVNCDT